MLRGEPTLWNGHKELKRLFQTLIERCTDTPILAYADFSLPFELHIDASGIGLGAVLYQTQEGKKRVIAYG